MAANIGSGYGDGDGDGVGRGMDTSQIIAAYRKHFPNGWIQISESSLGGKTSTFIKFGVQSTTNVVNGISENDRGFHILKIEGQTLSLVVGGSLAVPPPAGSHLAFGSVKVGFRKKTGTPEQLIAYLAAYCAKLRAACLENGIEGLGI